MCSKVNSQADKEDVSAAWTGLCVVVLTVADRATRSQRKPLEVFHYA